MEAIENLQSLDLTTQHGIATARNRFLRSARERGDHAAINDVLSAIISANPHRTPEYVERLINAYEMGDTQQAEKYFEDLFTTFNDLTRKLSGGSAVLILRYMRKTGKHDRAVALAPELLENIPKDVILVFEIYMVFEDLGRIDEVINIAQKLYGLAEDRPDYRARLLSYLTGRGYTTKVFELLDDKSAVELGDLRLVLEMAHAHLRAYPTDPKGIEILEDAYAFSPENHQIQIALIKGYLQFGRGKDADAVMNLMQDELLTQKESWSQLRAEVHVANGRFAEASEIYSALLQKSPRHGGWRRSGIGALLQAGEHVKAAAMYEEDRAQRRPPPKDRFEDCLRSLDENLDQADIAPVRFDWAYRKLTQFGAAPSDRHAWEQASKKVYLADKLTLDWLETRPKDVDQVLERFDNPQGCLEPLLECLDEGTGAFISSLHMGAMFAGPALLQAQGVDFRWLASTPSIAEMPGTEKLLSTSSSSQLAVARGVFKAIRSGRAVTVAIDGAPPAASRPMSFFGDDMLVTDLVPRTVLQTGVRSFFPKIIWKDDRLSVELIELIPPEDGDSVDAYTNLWFTDFFDCVREMCVDAPDNMRLAGGFWTNLAL